MSYSVIEQFTQAKTGNEVDNEDKVVITDYFVAVIDGMTPLNKSLYSWVSPAKLCTELLADCIRGFSSTVTCSEAVAQLTDYVKGYYEKNDILEEVYTFPHKRMGANIIIYSHKRQEIWFVGDCHCLIDGRHITNEKLVDTLLAAMRSSIIREYLLTCDILDLLNEDLSSNDLKPFLQQQYRYQNNQLSSPLSYTVIDGFPVITNMIKVVDVRNASEIVLASDGFLILKESLRESENALRHLLKNDPLCYQLIPTTKGLRKGNVSFDDRSYIKLIK